jgi:hypothetical protein
MYKKILLAAGIVALFNCGVFSADNTGKSWFETTIKSLKAKIARRYQASSVGAASVAAVRGANVADEKKDKPYWKGTQEDKREKKLQKQRKQLAAALEPAVAGKKSDAQKAVEKFIKENPESPYLEEAKEALRRVKEMPDESPSSVASAPAAQKDAVATVNATAITSSRQVTPAAPAAGK